VLVFLGPDRREGGKGNMVDGRYHSLGNLAGEGGGGGRITRVEGVDRVSGVGMHPHPQQAGPKIPS